MTSIAHPIRLDQLRRQASLFEEPVLPKLPQADRPIALTTDVSCMLEANAVVALAVSGGKDGAAMALAVVKHLDRMGHTGPRVLIHADLGSVEWKDSLPSCERLAKLLGIELLVVRRNAGDMMARWAGRWSNNVARYESLSCVRVILPWSTPSMRFCTSELKTAVITSHLRKRFPKHNIINVVGIRRQESANRRKMPISAPMPTLVRKGFTGLAWNAVIEWPVEDVWSEIHASGLAPHEAYIKYNSSRVSCSYCIMASEADLLASASCEDNHAILREMVGLEARSTFGFQGARWLADIAPQLLDTELRERVAHGKAMAVVRQAAEAEIPKAILFEKGWPTSVLNRQQAESLASVRQRVSTALGLSASCLDAESIIARYEQLMRERGGGEIEGELDAVTHGFQTAAVAELCV